jgi:hypothetical protein
MKSFVQTALLGAAGLVALSLSAHAAGSTAGTEKVRLNSTPATQAIHLAQRNENPGGGMYRNENPGGGMFRNENPGGGMYKKSKKKKKAH